MGCMIRFSEDANHNCYGYVFMMIGSAGGYPYLPTYGTALYKINGKQFAYANLEKVATVDSNYIAENGELYWKRSTYQTIRFVAKDNNIKVYYEGDLIIDYTDPNPINSGSYGFFSVSQPDARFRNIYGDATLAQFNINFNANGGTINGGGATAQIVTSTKPYNDLPTVAARSG